MSLSHNEMFSIIVPTYNRASLISETLASLKTQNYRPIEIIVVDDGSTDETRKIVAAWAEDYEEYGALSIRYFYQNNAGPASARNLGIEKAKGKFVQFLDSDDRIHLQRFERLVEVFEKTGADFIQTGFDGFDAETGEIIERHFARPEENQVVLALKGFLWANTLRSALRRSLVDKIGPWDKKMTCFEDREYVERAVVMAEKPVAIRDILASARRGGSERVSDRLRTYEGRTFRVICEERLAKGISQRSDLSTDAKRAFASRIYALGFRCNAKGWLDLGKRCGDIAAGLGVDLDAKGRLRRLVWKSGRIGGMAYGALAKSKRVLGVG